MDVFYGKHVIIRKFDSTMRLSYVLKNVPYV